MILKEKRQSFPASPQVLGGVGFGFHGLHLFLHLSLEQFPRGLQTLTPSHFGRHPRSLMAPQRNLHGSEGSEWRSEVWVTSPLRWKKLCLARGPRQVPSARRAHLGQVSISGPAEPGRELPPTPRSLHLSANCPCPSRLPLEGDKTQALSPGPRTSKPPELPLDFFPLRQDRGQSWALAGLNLVCEQRGPPRGENTAGKGWENDGRGLRLMGAGL